jgi:hypothetical protein
MKSLIDLWQELADDLGSFCCVSTALDAKTVQSRTKNEGSSFLTITLPSFSRGLEKALARGSVVPQDFPGFAWRSGLPLFLGGFLERIFVRKTGVLRDVPCVDSIFAVRQLSLFYSKMLLPCSVERDRAAIHQYIACEQDVREYDSNRTAGLYEEFRRMSLVMFGDVMATMDRDIHSGQTVPRHGPGATADKLRGNAKFDQHVWTERLESIFPYGENAIPNWRYNLRLERLDILEPGAEIPVKVITVPKTLKTPRIIAVEPTCMQYMQQAISERLTNYLEHSHVRDRIGFSDQGPNQALAAEGSSSELLATLDLSEASDRVSNQLVRSLVHHFPSLGEGLDATRSRKADVPGYGVKRLAKFASMGSALCFPIEAMVFLNIVAIGISRQLKTRFTGRNVNSYLRGVRVYGDDIICPVEYASSVITALEDFGLRVNRDKSFWTGKFRESCGKDYYDGCDVSVVKCRRTIPTGRSDVSELISLVSLRNNLYKRGLWKTAFYLDTVIEPLLRHYPYVCETSPVLGKHSFLGYETQRVSADTQSPQVRGYTVRTRIPASPMSGEATLLKWFLKRGSDPFALDHQERAGRPESVGIRLRWANST